MPTTNFGRERVAPDALGEVVVCAELARENAEKASKASKPGALVFMLLLNLYRAAVNYWKL
jgi:ssRNA-specific RNase YbeY (16S rRNA maturation enzyme)